MLTFLIPIARTPGTTSMTRSIISNAAARLPFEGVADLYRALHADRNPLFYVSSSPWNLYELLDDYMEINKIPHGPMLLQDWGIEETVLILASHEEHVCLVGATPHEEKTRCDA